MDKVVIDQESRENVTIRMRPSLKQALKIAAIQEGRGSMSDLLEELSRNYLTQSQHTA